MKNSLGVCIIGCGWSGNVHAEGWSKVENATIVAVADVQEERAKKMANAYGLSRYFDDFDEALRQPGIDVVSVCVPSFLHSRITVAAAELGHHVYCEKPIALTLEQADDMVRAAKKNSIQLGIDFMRHHSPIIAAVKDYLDSERATRPVLYYSSDIREIRPKIAMHDLRANGGPLIDVSVHTIETWNTIFDCDPIEVYAKGLCLGKDRPELKDVGEIAPDTHSLTVTYESGDVGIFVVTWGLPPGATPEQHPEEFYGSKGMGQLHFQRTKQEFRLLEEGGIWRSVVTSHEDMYHRGIRNFADAILSGRDYTINGERGRDVLRVAYGARESIETGKAVRLK